MDYDLYKSYMRISLSEKELLDSKKNIITYGDGQKVVMVHHKDRHYFLQFEDYNNFLSEYRKSKINNLLEE